ncbi:alanyl (membrane) aminopeptidase-like b isoform X2 [Synchiropus splendidus]|uniref:alanyl (membrane) aminopeptidase-like b isoform X2 n=1 Tax=Synchiropus splendidus TaxID=270530 RepID=UPI00237D901B|nr:alanyl (membrane) aminopeptidase-like b isoform X2 [Synchiropus splendidus]
MRNANKARIGIAVLLLVILGIVGIVTFMIFHRARWSTRIVRLPENLSPEEYTVVLQPHFYTRLMDDTNTTREQIKLLTGNSTVKLHCVERTNKIVLHASDLNISNPVVINLHDNRTLGVRDVRQEEGQILEIRLNQHLEKGHKYSLFLDFRRELSGGLSGLYLSGYSDQERLTAEPDRFLVVTNMEPSDARMVFPCFDEPHMKAVFHVAVIHRRNTTALGNAAARESRVINDDWMVTHFHPTPKMSTYLFAIVVSEFTALTSEHPRVKIQIHARPSATQTGRSQVAVNITGRILSFYEEYLGIEYGLSKLDQIALPDLHAAAMENWGLVTYKELSLLQFPITDPGAHFLHRVNIAYIVAHELAHQWFGNLVTMKWWNEVWLNEGFANYMTRPVMKQLLQDPDFVDLMEMRSLQECLQADAGQSHPLTVPPEDIQTPSDLYTLFDIISYNKGAAVLTMLASAIGEQVFLRGLKMYLREFSYNNTDQYDLWRTIQKAVDDSGGHVDVTEVMTSWTTQTGFPLLTIDTTTGEVVQEHWSDSDKDSSRRWHVPVHFMTGTSGSSVVFLQNHRKVQRDELKSRNGAWILANVNYTGYYKVNYDPGNWQRLVSQLETDLHRIPMMNRMALIQSAFEFSRNFQSVAVHIACSNDLPECVDMASKTLANWLASNQTEKNKEHLDSESLEYLTLCRGMAAAGESEWDQVWDLVTSFNRTELYPLLACSTNTSLLQRYLQYTLDAEKIPLMYSHNIVADITRSVAGHQLAWDFMQAHWEHFRQEWTGWRASMLLHVVAKRFTSEAELTQLETIESKYNPDTDLTRTKERIRQNIRWFQKNEGVVRAWFQREAAA